MIAQPTRLGSGFDYLKEGVEQWLGNWRVFALIAAPCAVLSLLALRYGHFNPLWMLLTIFAGLFRIVQYGAALSEVRWLQTGHRSTGVQRDSGRAFRNASRFLLIWTWLLAAAPVALGIVLLAVPGLVIGVWLAFTPYAVVYDNRRGMEALSHSRNLVRGRFWPVAGRVLVIALVPMATTVFTAGFARMIFGFLGVPASFLNWVFNALEDAIIVPITIAAGGLLYRDLAAQAARTTAPAAVAVSNLATKTSNG